MVNYSMRAKYIFPHDPDDSTPLPPVPPTAANTQARMLLFSLQVMILTFILHEGHPCRHRDGVKIQQILQAEKEDEEGNILPTRSTKSTLPR